MTVNYNQNGHGWDKVKWGMTRHQLQSEYGIEPQGGRIVKIPSSKISPKSELFDLVEKGSYVLVYLSDETDGFVERVKILSPFSYNTTIKYLIDINNIDFIAGDHDEDRCFDADGRRLVNSSSSEGMVSGIQRVNICFGDAQFASKSSKNFIRVYNDDSSYDFRPTETSQIYQIITISGFKGV